MSEDFRTKSQLRENRLEREHNDPEPADFEECRHCDNLTEPNRKEGRECGECYNPYGLNEDETHEYHQNQISDLEKKNKDQAAEIAELKAKLGAVLPEGYPCTLPGSNGVYWVIQAMDPEGVPRYLNTSYLGRWEREGVLSCAERFRNPKTAKEALLSLRNDLREHGQTDETSRIRNLTYWKITEVVERGFYKPMDPELLEWCVRVGRDISELLKATDTKK